jgi:hypothetical protein
MAKGNNVYFMSAVGFKPPHKGHLHMIKEAVNKAASRGANYKLFIGRSPRGSITLGQSLEMLNLFLNDAGVSLGDGIGEVSINPVPESNPTGRVYGDNPKNKKLGRVGKRIYTSSPLQPLINLAAEMPEGSKIVVPSSSEDSERADILKKILSRPRPDIEVEGMIVDPVAALDGEGKLSATGMREAIDNDEFEKFKKYIPESSLDKAEGIWTNTLGRELPVDNLDATEINEMIKECLKDTVKEILKEGWADDDLGYQMDQADAQEGEDDWRDPMNYVDEDDENPNSDHWRAILRDAVTGNAEAVEIRDAVFKLRGQHRLARREKDAQRRLDTDDLEEVSSMAGGAVEGGAGRSHERDDQDTIIREVYDYLINTKAIRVD